MFKRINYLEISRLLALTVAGNSRASAEEVKGLTNDEIENEQVILKEIEQMDKMKKQAESKLKAENLRIEKQIEASKVSRDRLEELRKAGKPIQLPKEDSPSDIGTLAYSHSISWSNWSYGDIILGNGPSSGSSSTVPYGYYRHGATYDSYYGNFISAAPSNGVRRESKNFWSTNYKSVAGYWVPSSSSSQRFNVVSYLRQQMGEPYQWNSSKTNYAEWYCTKLPYVAYKGNAAIDIDGDGGYWVFPDDIANDDQTRLFMSSSS